MIFCGWMPYVMIWPLPPADQVIITFTCCPVYFRIVPLVSYYQGVSDFSARSSSALTVHGLSSSGFQSLLLLWFSRLLFYLLVYLPHLDSASPVFLRFHLSLIVLPPRWLPLRFWPSPTHSLPVPDGCVRIFISYLSSFTSLTRKPPHWTQLRLYLLLWQINYPTSRSQSGCCCHLYAWGAYYILTE